MKAYLKKKKESIPLSIYFIQLLNFKHISTHTYTIEFKITTDFLMQIFILLINYLVFFSKKKKNVNDIIEI